MHEGHRERMRAKFLKSGIDLFEDHEILELLLYDAIPRQNTNETAHLLLDQFHSFSGVLDAPIGELERVKGVGRSAAVFLKMLPQVCRKYYEDRQEKGKRIYSLEEAEEMLSIKFIGRDKEVVVLLLLDSDSNVLFCDVVAEGSTNAAPIYMRKIVGLAVEYNANSAILAHNHPSGNPLPSVGDRDVTRNVYEALNSVEVNLLDHIIFGKKNSVSMSHLNIPEGLFEPF